MNPGMFVFPIMDLIGALSRLVRRLFARDGSKFLENTTDAPVLFLRSFEDDSAGLKGGIGDLYEQREEAFLERTFRAAGPVVAIRRPGSLLPETGAARIKAANSDWQEKVVLLIKRCRFVVLRVAATDGLLWEIETVLKEAAPEKAILYIGNEDRISRWQTFLMATAGIFPVTLPKDVDDALFVVFKPDWTPQLLGSINKSGDMPGAKKFVWLFLSMVFIAPIAFIVSAVQDNLNTLLSLGLATIFTVVGVWLIKAAIQFRILSAVVLGLLPGLFFVLRFFPDFLDSGLALLLMLWIPTIIIVALQLRTKLDGALLLNIGLLDQSVNRET